MARWPPIFASYLLARTTMASAFQRTRLLMRRSICAVARIGHLFFRRNGVDVGGVPAQGDLHAQVGGAFHQVFEQVTGPVGAYLIDDFIEGFNPFGGFLGVEVVGCFYLWLSA